jgi:hypothetical protein
VCTALFAARWQPFDLLTGEGHAVPVQVSVQHRSSGATRLFELGLRRACTREGMVSEDTNGSS